MIRNNLNNFENNPVFRWELGDRIVISTSQLWGTTIYEDDYVDATIVHTASNIVIKNGMVLGEEFEFTAATTPTVPPTPQPTPTSAVFTPTSVSDTSGGSAAVSHVGTDGDGLYTTYNMPKQSTYDETVYQQFNFTPGLASSPTQVLVRINHTEFNNAKGVKIQVWEQNALAWHDESIDKTTTWMLEEVDVSTYIDTQDDINNLNVRYMSHTNAANKVANIEYVAVYVEWSA